MGVAASNRGSESIKAGLRDGQRPIAYEIMDRINAMPKNQSESCRLGIRATYHTSFKSGAIFYSHGAWMLTDAADIGGACRVYKTLADAVRSWDIELTGYSEITGVWTSENIINN